ncbi:MAG: hypothetical protein ACJ75H_00365 [Thermoanaerobaculia bacterium]
MSVQEMPLLEEFLRVDQENSESSRRLLLQLHPRSIDIAERGATVFDAASEALGRESKISENQRGISEWAGKYKIESKHALQLLSTASLIGGVEDDFTRAKENFVKGVAFYARLYLVMRLRRDYLFGLTDLLRLRRTASQGYLRLQAETVAVLAMSLDEPEVGQEWLETMEEDKGKAFYKKYHKRVVQKIKDLGLHFYYEQASQNALHSRVGGVASGVVQGNAVRDKGEVALVYQEANDPYSFFLWLCSYLRFHEILSRSLLTVVPEAVTDLAEEIRLFREGVEELWELLGAMRASQKRRA